MKSLPIIVLSAIRLVLGRPDRALEILIKGPVGPGKETKGAIRCLK